MHIRISARTRTTLKDGQLLLAVWVPTPEGVRAFSAGLSGEELENITPEEVCDELAAHIKGCLGQQARAQPGLV